MRGPLIPIALLATAAGCTTTGPTPERPCFLTPSTWNMDDQNPVGRMVILNTGRSCGITVSADRRPNETSGTIVQQPSHGTARIRYTGQGVMAAYTPNPGFSGQDTFQARFGPGSQTMTIDITVRSPGA